MRKFSNSFQEVTLRKYLPYLSLEMFGQAIERKLKCIRSLKERERLEFRRSRLPYQLELFHASIERDEALADDIFEAIHFAASFCWNHATKDAVLLSDIRSGKAFAGIMRGTSESGIVWDRFDQETMRSVKPPAKINKARKLRS